MNNLKISTHKRHVQTTFSTEGKNRHIFWTSILGFSQIQTEETIPVSMILAILKMHTCDNN